MNLRGPLAAASLILTAACAAALTGSRFAINPEQAADELLAADRAFSAASAKTNVTSGLAAMFAPDVAVPLPRRQLAMTSTAMIAALETDPDNAAAHITWAPSGVGISADGTHGYTYGYMTMENPNKSAVPMKYLAYWVKGRAGWRVAAYKRVPRSPGDTSAGPRVRTVPARGIAAVNGGMDALRKSLDSAERSFSDDAQLIGLGPAFVRYGAQEAINLGGPNEKTFVYGPDAIARLVSDGPMAPPSPVYWAPDRVLVAPSGDLGLTIGWITSNDPPGAGQARARFPFFTVWRRATTSDPWRYVAE